MFWALSVKSERRIRLRVLCRRRVGAMMTVLMGIRQPQAIARACDLGVAMQLTNIARDVGEDARAGRLFAGRGSARKDSIPTHGSRRLSGDPKSPGSFHVCCGKQICSMIAPRRHLRSSEELPPGIFAARRLYHAIGSEVVRNGF